MQDDDDLDVEDSGEVDPAPWTLHDTTAVLFQFGYDVSEALTDMFEGLRDLAFAAAGYQWKKMNEAEFAANADKLIKSLTEGESDA